MPRHLFTVCLVSSLLILAACKGSSDKPTAARPDALAGTWSGDWGPSAQERNTVVLELKWDGANLTGTVNPGPDAVALGRVSFNSATNTLTMEADAKRSGGAIVHYVIEGKVAGKTIAGSWTHDDRTGDFTITKG
jgi:hypothetical protein